jgi:hypothetical protein
MKNKKQLLVTAALLLVLCVLVYFFVFNKSKNTLASEGNTLYTWRDTAANYFLPHECAVPSS